jgi:ABC-type transporter Mla subunit MlaD
MENMSRRVRRMQWRSDVHRRASARLATNLNSASEEMARNEPNAEEIDALKTTVIGWVSEYERILEEAQPAIDRRDEDVMDAYDDRHEEAEQTVERALEDFESNDQMFDETATEAQAAMEAELESNGVVADAEDLADEIDATLSEINRSMMRQRRNARSLRRIRSARNVQSLGEMSDAMTEELPSGAEVHAQW